MVIEQLVMYICPCLWHVASAIKDYQRVNYIYMYMYNMQFFSPADIVEVKSD